MPTVGARESSRGGPSRVFVAAGKVPALEKNPAAEPLIFKDAAAGNRAATPVKRGSNGGESFSLNENQLPSLDDPERFEPAEINPARRA